MTASNCRCADPRGDWAKAETVLDSVPPTHETFKRYRLEAMVADSKQEWKKADSFYEIAVGLTTTPASVMNNWGYSKLTRGDYTEAERLFSEADPSGHHAVHRQEQPDSGPRRAARLHAARDPHGPDRARAAFAHDGPVRDQTGRCRDRQRPAARSHRYPPAAFRGRRAFAAGLGNG